jgi:hypothetical protein
VGDANSEPDLGEDTAGMRGGVVALILVGLTAAGVPCYAQKPSSEASIGKRQIASCMSRRMAADRLMPFNEAAKICKDQLKSHKTDTAANVASKPVG